MEPSECMLVRQFDTSKNIPVFLFFKGAEAYLKWSSALYIDIYQYVTLLLAFSKEELKITTFKPTRLC